MVEHRGYGGSAPVFNRTSNRKIQFFDRTYLQCLKTVASPLEVVQPWEGEARGDAHAVKREPTQESVTITSTRCRYRERQRFEVYELDRGESSCQIRSRWLDHQLSPFVRSFEVRWWADRIACLAEAWQL